jgi:hypothetical protein
MQSNRKNVKKGEKKTLQKQNIQKLQKRMELQVSTQG